MELPADAPTIRLCHLTKWPDFDGYGFNLHTDKLRNIQTLGDIDKGSPAEAAGLMKGDRIVEINGQNVFNENHRQVVERIKAVPHETRLLVVDSVSDMWYRDRNIVINGSLPSVRKLSSARDSSGSLNTKSINGGEPAARLCHLRKWADFDGYGFNLHADKAKGTRFVGVVDSGSPAEAAGMRQNDKIVEVNGENVEKLSHREIVDRIKAVPNEATLLVVDDSTRNFYADRGIPISSSMKNVIRLETPSINPHQNNRKNTTTVIIHKSANEDTTNNEINKQPMDQMPPLPSTPPPPLIEENGHREDWVPRLCLLRKWPDYDGYGFNLHADKQINLHFIGEVDEGSPAKLGGLRPGDRVVEVNGTNIDHMTHREIIERIKSNPQQAELLVVCKNTDRLYRERGGLVPRSDMVEVRRIATPLREAEVMAADQEGSSKCSNSPKMIPSTPSSNRSEELPPAATPSAVLDEYDVNGVNSPSPANNVEPPAYFSEVQNGRLSVDSALPPASAPSRTAHQGNNHIREGSADSTRDHLAHKSSRSINGSPTGSDGNNTSAGGDVSPIFLMKVSDVRDLLKQRKKKDPRVQNMDLMQKFKIMEQL